MNRKILPVVELATFLLTVAVIVGFGRLFTDWSYVRQLLVVAIAAHAIAIVCRRAQLGLILSSLASLAGLVIVGSNLFLADSTRFGLPTGATRTALRLELDGAWTAFQDVSAPAVPVEGFVITAALGIWLIAYLVDWAAFRLDSVIESLVPGLALFGFQTFMGANQHQALAVATFAGAALFFLLTHRTARFELDGTWLGENATPGTLSLLRVGSGLAALTVLTGVVVGPGLPGAADDPIIELDPGGGGGGTRIAINPLVEIRSQLVDLPDTVAFIGTTTIEGEYWKLASLDDFNGSEWTLGDDFDDADGNLASREPAGIETEIGQQEVRIENLSSDWLPAMYQPRRFESNSLNAEWDADTGSLLIESNRPLARGDTYTVWSELPVRTRAFVNAQVGDDIPEEIAANNLDLPDGFSPQVSDEARRIVTEAGAVSAFDQALALQNYFQQNFRYDLDVVKGHSNERIEDFLFDSRAGYCEQFAGSYAAMARTLGLPTRVAVGFTTGERISGTDSYRVRGRHAHAWPEVWLAGVGWVAFEPTPGRGAARNEDITGLTPQPSETTPPDTIPEDATNETVPTRPQQTIPEDAPPDVQQVPGVPNQASGFSFGPWGWRLFYAAAAVALAAAVRFLLLRAKKQARERHRGDPNHSREVVLAAWLDSLNNAGHLGVRRTASETPSELSRRTSPSLGTVGDPFKELAGLATAAQFSKTKPTAAAADRAAIISDGIREHALASMSRRRRILHELDPRPLVRAHLHRQASQRQTILVD